MNLNDIEKSFRKAGLTSSSIRNACGFAFVAPDQDTYPSMYDCLDTIYNAMKNGHVSRKKDGLELFMFEPSVEGEHVVFVWTTSKPVLDKLSQTLDNLSPETQQVLRNVSSLKFTDKDLPAGILATRPWPQQPSPKALASFSKK